MLQPTCIFVIWLFVQKLCCFYYIQQSMSLGEMVITQIYESHIAHRHVFYITVLLYWIVDSTIFTILRHNVSKYSRSIPGKEYRVDDLSFVLAAGWSWFWHWRVGLGEAARILVVARPHRILVDDGTEQSCRGNQMGHVVWRWKILSGESLKPRLILLLGDIFFSRNWQPRAEIMS